MSVSETKTANDLPVVTTQSPSMNGALTARPSTGREMWLFQRLRWRIQANTLRTIVQESPIRLVAIFLCSGVIWLSIFGVSAGGFTYLQTQKIPVSGGLFGTVFDLLFLALAVLLIFSTSIILYTSLFAGHEAGFLLATPAPADKVFAFKYQGAVAFGSWAFVILGSPILIGYGLAESVPWFFYALLPLYFVGFVLLPGSLGALLCLLVVNFLPNRRKQVFFLTGLAVLGLGAWWAYQAFVFSPTYNWDREMLNRLLDRFGFSQGVLVPSHWMTLGLQATGRGELGKAAYYLALLWSNGLFLYVVVAWLAKLLYRRGYNRVATGGTLRRRYGGAWLDGTLTRLVPFLHPQVRLLIVKDFRTFRRDPAQWAQTLILSSLMVLYFTNMRRMFFGEIDWNYQNGISLLNVCAIGLLLSAYTGRFIYPMLSLEGRKFWILGLLPLPRERLLWGKFAFSATGGLLIAESLAMLSDLMLGLPPLALILHFLTVLMLATGLSGLSVGLGAMIPNFRETDPSKIAGGFGGTLNLVAGLVYLCTIIGLMAVPWHLHAAKAGRANFESPQEWLSLAVLVGLGVAAGMAAIIVPLLAGTRALRRMEF